VISDHPLVESTSVCIRYVRVSDRARSEVVQVTVGPIGLSKLVYDLEAVVVCTLYNIDVHPAQRYFLSKKLRQIQDRLSAHERGHTDKSLVQIRSPLHDGSNLGAHNIHSGYYKCKCSGTRTVSSSGIHRTSRSPCLCDRCGSSIFPLWCNPRRWSRTFGSSSRNRYGRGFACMLHRTSCRETCRVCPSCLHHFSGTLSSMINTSVVYVTPSATMRPKGYDSINLFRSGRDLLLHEEFRVMTIRLAVQRWAS